MISFYSLGNFLVISKSCKQFESRPFYDRFIYKTFYVFNCLIFFIISGLDSYALLRLTIDYSIYLFSLYYSAFSFYFSAFSFYLFSL